MIGAVGRSLILSRIGEHARAIAAVAGGAPSVENLDNSACVHALSSSACKGTGRSPAEGEATAAERVTFAVALLDRARRAGYFEDPANLAER